MLNITVTVDDDTDSHARMSAAEGDSSACAPHQAEIERLKRQEREIRRCIEAFDASDKLPRETLHGRPL
jgi:hypothetical protein